MQHGLKITEPEPNDILCGKDKQCVAHVGSVRFRGIIDSYRQKYASSLTKFDKMQITKEIYENLTQSSRFLKFNTKEKVWEEISPMAARDKCGHALRFANRVKVKGKNALGMRLAPETAGMFGLAVPSSLQQLSSTVSSSSASSSSRNSPSQSPAGPSPSPGVQGPVTAVAPVVVPPMPQLQHQQQYQHQQHQQRLASAATVGATGGALQQREMWGDLLNRYDTMWNAASIPVVDAKNMNSNSFATSTTSATSSPPSVVSLTNSFQQQHQQYVGEQPLQASATLSSLSASMSGGGQSQSQSSYLLNSMRQQLEEQQRQNQRRRSTLDDLCSILGEPSIQQLLGSTKSN